MKLCTYSLPADPTQRLGFLQDGQVVDAERCRSFLNHEKELPLSMREILSSWEENFAILRSLSEALEGKDLANLEFGGNSLSHNEEDIIYHAPVPDPPSFRDFYAFEQHVRAARKLRGLEMNPLWYEIPIFYFSNHNQLFAHRDDFPYPKGCDELDFELEFAAVIANGGQDVSAEEAKPLIAGYTILNDWSARDFQREEMQLNLGPAKGKDFGSSFGPWLVTADELEDAWDENGKLQLRMTCHVNGKLISDGNTNDLYHSFPSMIERASRNAMLMPGDYIGSGTVGTGCILELRPESVGGWIREGDVVRMEVEGLGVLENRVIGES